MRMRGGPPRGPMRGGPRGFRGGPMRGGGGDRGGRSFPPGPQGPGPHPVPTIETRGAPPQSMCHDICVIHFLLTHCFLEIKASV